MIYIFILQIALGACLAQNQCSITLQCLNGGEFSTETCKCECKYSAIIFFHFSRLKYVL
jgi:hypothetical protein